MGRRKRRPKEPAIKYITYQQLYADTLAFAPQLPPDLTCIAGIPRSGMIPATMLALHLQLPVADIYSLCGGCKPIGGMRVGGVSSGGVTASAVGGHVLVIDDSIYCGSALRAAKERIMENRFIGGNAAFPPDTRFTFAAVYRHPGRELHKELDCDIYFRNVRPRRYFQWNLLQHPDLAGALLDIDGVLCRDPTVPDDDGPEYVQALVDAVPLHTPRVTVGGLITCRLERWRPQTEAWLAARGVMYGSLTMSPYATAAERRRGEGYGEWKGRHYRESTATLFVESSAEQAPAIAKVSGKPVICLDDSCVYE